MENKENNYQEEHNLKIQNKNQRLISSREEYKDDIISSKDINGVIVDTDSIK